MKPFSITTSSNTVYTVKEIKGTPNGYQVSKDSESSLFFRGSNGQWSTGDFAPPFADFNINEIGKLIEFELKLNS